MQVFPESSAVVVNQRGTTVVITIDPGLYSEDVVLRAAYWLSDSCHVHINKTNAGAITAEIRTKDGRDGPELTAACGEFCNGLIDFALRARVASETQDIHRALVQRAFSELLPHPMRRG